jgi:hypothetical protein
MARAGENMFKFVESRMNRQFIFKHYWWISLLGALLGVGLVVFGTAGQKASLVGSIVAAALGFCYFAQQQKLAEMALFKTLFTEFNLRYDKLNERLQRIATSDRPLDADARQTIIEYYNLCGEEYLFFAEGYIHRNAWRSWCAGMLWYFDREPFKKIWAEENSTNSYYGLSLDDIRRGAA